MNLFGYEVDGEYIILAIACCFLLLLILCIVTLVKQVKLKKRLASFMSGKDAKNLEKIITERFEEIDSLKESNKNNEEQIKALHEKMKITYQKMGMVKYDAFNEMGGKLSFTVALLNEKNDGFILSGMHSREGCYTYIKDVIDGNSIIILSEEEKEALEIAKNQE